jgi:hypothetical protein
LIANAIAACTQSSGLLLIVIGLLILSKSLYTWAADVTTS